jgi:hypothetical protein
VWPAQQRAQGIEKGPSVLEEDVHITRTAPGRIPDGHLHILGVSLGDSLRSVEAKLGPGKRFRLGSDPEPLAVLCYEVQTNGGPVAVAFESNSMGAWKDVTRVIVGRPQAFGRWAVQCHEAPLFLPDEVATQGGLALQLTRSDLKALFPAKPIVDTEGRIDYYFEATGFWSGALISLAADRVDWFILYASSQ